MSHLNGHGDADRRRKLDELFADEPYLSATMKARLLHEKLAGEESGFPPLPEIPKQAHVSPAPQTPVMPPTPALVEDGEPHLSFRMAAAMLNQPDGSGATESHLADRLRAFRETELAQWLAYLPREDNHEACGPGMPPNGDPGRIG